MCSFRKDANPHDSSPCAAYERLHLCLPQASTTAMTIEHEYLVNYVAIYAVHRGIRLVRCPSLASKLVKHTGDMVAGDCNRHQLTNHAVALSMTLYFVNLLFRSFLIHTHTPLLVSTSLECSSVCWSSSTNIYRILCRNHR
jgi:hypothetical protein